MRKNREIYDWKGPVIIEELYAKPCNICQQFKMRKTLYGHLPPKNIAEQKPRDSVNVDMIVTYSKYIRQQHPGDAIIRNNVILNCMKMINPTTGRFEIFEILAFDLNDVTGGNDEYMDKSPTRVSQLLNNTWTCR